MQGVGYIIEITAEFTFQYPRCGSIGCRENRLARLLNENLSLSVP